MHCHEPIAKSNKKSAELIFGLMITGKDSTHQVLSKLAIENFFNQSHPSKVLIVVNDGMYSTTDEQRPCLVEYHVEKNATVLLGTLRNIAMQLVPNDAVFVQWDDDDWHADSFLEKQLRELRIETRLKTKQGIIHPTILVFLQNQMQYYLPRNLSWPLFKRTGFVGTVMSRMTPKVRKFRYENKNLGEDDLLRNYFPRSVRLWPNPAHMYIRLIHGHNSWDITHFHKSFRVASFFDLYEQDSFIMRRGYDKKLVAHCYAVLHQVGHLYHMFLNNHTIYKQHKQAIHSFGNTTSNRTSSEHIRWEARKHKISNFF